MEVIKVSLKTLDRAIAILKNGGVVICPTDTVYGFLADATNKKAVDKIYKIKKRPTSKPLPVFVKDFKMAENLAEIDEKQAKVLRKFWPGRYTFIFNRKNYLVSNSIELDTKAELVKLYGVDKKTIAIRIPKYKFLNQLLQKINMPLAQTSVNISSEPTLTKIEDIIKKFGKSKKILIIDGGNIKKGKPSKIIDLSSKKLTRLR